MFLQPDGHVLKLWRMHDDEPKAQREYAVCRLLGSLAPTAHELVHVDGRPGLVMDRIEGDSLLTQLERRPYQLFRAARVLARVHVEMNACGAPRELPDLKELLVSGLALADMCRLSSEHWPPSAEACSPTLTFVTIVASPASNRPWIAGASCTPQSDSPTTSLRNGPPCCASSIVLHPLSAARSEPRASEARPSRTRCGRSDLDEHQRNVDIGRQRLGSRRRSRETSVGRRLGVAHRSAPG